MSDAENADAITERSEISLANTSSSQMNDMFAALLGEMKSMNANFTSLALRRDDSFSESEDNEDDDDTPTHTNTDATEESLRQLISSASTGPSEGETSSDFLKDIAQDLNVKESTDSAINEELAKIFQTLLKDKMSEEKLKVKVDKYVRPENVELRVPKVNPLIWSQLASGTRAQDSRSQKSQSALVGALIASVKAANIALTKYGSDKELLTLLTDSVAMGLQFYQDVNQSRRVAMKQDLHKDFTSLCNANQVETTEFLFGDVSKLTKDIAEANKLTKRVRHSSSRSYSDKRSSSGSHRRFQPYNNKARKSGDFLGQDRFRHKRKKDNKPSHQQ